MANPRPEHFEPVVNGAKKVKKRGWRKFVNSFFAADFETVKKTAWKEVIAPGIRDLVFETGSNALSMFLFGDTAGVGRGRSRGTHYESIYNSRSNVGRAAATRNSKPTSSNKRRSIPGPYSYEEVCCETRADAKDLIDNMRDIVETYGYISVMDLYDLAEMDTEFTDQNYGWDDVSGASIYKAAPDEYIIKMERPIPLN